MADNSTWEEVEVELELTDVEVEFAPARSAISPN
jgi:hypothetical protein